MHSSKWLTSKFLIKILIDSALLIKFPISRTSNAEEIAMRLATRRAEQRLRQEEHQLNMDMIRHRVKQKPLLLEGQQQLLDFGLPSHNCDTPVNRPKNHCNAPVLIKTHIFSKQPRLKRPGSSKLSLSSTDSKTSTLSNSKFNWN